MMSLQNPGAVPLAKRREDEVSVGSTPLVKQSSNQASDYASSPVKTKTVTGRFTNSSMCFFYIMNDCTGKCISYMILSHACNGNRLCHMSLNSVF